MTASLVGTMYSKWSTCSHLFRTSRMLWAASSILSFSRIYSYWKCYNTCCDKHSFNGTKRLNLQVPFRFASKTYSHIHKQYRCITFPKFNSIGYSAPMTWEKLQAPSSDIFKTIRTYSLSAHMQHILKDTGMVSLNISTLM